jgi:selenocysteine lyase/cysteine desulfurase
VAPRLLKDPQEAWRELAALWKVPLGEGNACAELAKSQVQCFTKTLPLSLVRALDRPEVRALTVSWVQFASGYRVDLARLGRLCRERGVWFVVDAIQGVGAATLDVRACHVDLLACGAQKWLLSPWGSGFLYVRHELV